MPKYKIDKQAEGQNREQGKSGSKRLCHPSLHRKRSQMQAIDRQEGRSEKCQQRPVKIALWLVRGGRCESSFPSSAPRQRNGQRDGEALAQRTAGHEKVELRGMHEERNPADRQVQASGIKNK